MEPDLNSDYIGSVNGQPIYKGKPLPNLLEDPAPKPSRTLTKRQRREHRQAAIMARSQAEIAKKREDKEELHRFNMTTLLRKALFYRKDEAEKIVNQLITLAAKGNLNAINEIWNRLDGKPTEHHEIDNRQEIKLIFVPAEQLVAEEPRLVIEGSAKELPQGEQQDVRAYLPS